MVEITEVYLTSIRQYMRFKTSIAALDDEIKDKIQAARKDLNLAGVHVSHVEDETDALIKQAVGLYVKAEFGLDNEDAPVYRDAFEKLRIRLLLSDEYLAEKAAEETPPAEV